MQIMPLSQGVLLEKLHSFHVQTHLIRFEKLFLLVSGWGEKESHRLLLLSLVARRQSSLIIHHGG
jgi:hypothetical protein